MMSNKPELIFTIKGRHYWVEICDTIKRITAEYGNGDYALRIEVQELPCYSDKRIVYTENGGVKLEERDESAVL